MPDQLPAAFATDADAFAERMVGALNEAAMVAMTAVGHRLGLFDAMADASLLTSHEVADRAACAERYVREWLSCLAVARVLEHDPATARFRLPPAHAASLTRAASPANIAVSAQFIGMMGAIEDRLCAAFRSGAGIGYEAYTRFHEVMAEDSGQTVVAALDDHILPLIPELRSRLQAGIRVADLGCGAGYALLALAERFPQSTFVGYDLCAEPIAQARQLAHQRGLDNVTFEARDLAERPATGPFDWITTFDAVHDQADPAALLASIRRALAPGGVYLMQDIAGSSCVHHNHATPLAPLFYAVSTVHCTPVSLAQGGPGLGTMWGEETMRTMLAEAGFSAVACHHLPHDIANVYVVARP